MLYYPLQIHKKSLTDQELRAQDYDEQEALVANGSERKFVSETKRVNLIVREHKVIKAEEMLCR